MKGRRHARVVFLLALLVGCGSDTSGESDFDADVADDLGDDFEDDLPPDEPEDELPPEPMDYDAPPDDAAVWDDSDDDAPEPADAPSVPDAPPRTDSGTGVVCPAPPPAYMVVGGECVPSCGTAGGNTCAAAAAQCAGHPLLRSYDCPFCCAVPPACRPIILSDPHTSERLHCAYGPGTRVATTLGDVGVLRAAIHHVIVITQENHSVDSMFGRTGHHIEGWPSTYTNTTTGGVRVRPHHLANGCPPDPSHNRRAMVIAWDHGRMDGFARASGGRYQAAMGYYRDRDHPFYTWLATTFATSDRYFCAVLDATTPNRHYLYGGQYTPGRSVFNLLNEAHVAWADYTPGSGLEGAYGWRIGHPAQVRPWSEFFTAARAGTLPPVTYVDMPHDEHPSRPLHSGENDVREVIRAAMASPLWPHMAVLFTYDEGGGFFDHVPPPPACVAVPRDSAYDHYGERVPFILVSPYARAHYVSHAPHSHTSILRLIEAIFDLPALTKRDANADALFDLFDFGCPGFTRPPATVPAAFPPGC